MVQNHLDRVNLDGIVFSLTLVLVVKMHLGFVKICWNVLFCEYSGFIEICAYLVNIVVFPRSNYDELTRNDDILSFTRCWYMNCMEDAFLLLFVKVILPSGPLDARNCRDRDQPHMMARFWDL